jgi:hypothetical protein
MPFQKIGTDWWYRLGAVNSTIRGDRRQHRGGKTRVCIMGTIVASGFSKIHALSGPSQTCENANYICLQGPNKLFYSENMVKALEYLI